MRIAAGEVDGGVGGARSEFAVDARIAENVVDLSRGDLDRKLLEIGGKGDGLPIGLREAFEQPGADRRIQRGELLLAAFGQIGRVAALGEGLGAGHAGDQRQGVDIVLVYPPLFPLQGVLLALARALFV